MYIRSAIVDDAAAIAKVHVDSWRTTYKGILPDDFLTHLSYEQREPFWRQLLTKPDRTHHVYVTDDGHGQVVGFVSGGPERSGDTLYTGELYAIYLLVPYQGQGMGRQLVNALVTRLIQEGMTTLLLWVLAANPAQKFYERLGGQLVYEKTVTIAGMPLMEIAYGWRDAHTITELSNG